MNCLHLLRLWGFFGYQISAQSLGFCLCSVFVCFRKGWTQEKCPYSTSDIRRVTVKPGRTQEKCPYSTCDIRRITVKPGWTQEKRPYSTSDIRRVTVKPGWTQEKLSGSTSDIRRVIVKRDEHDLSDAWLIWYIIFKSWTSWLIFLW